MNSSRTTNGSSGRTNTGNERNGLQGTSEKTYRAPRKSCDVLTLPYGVDRKQAITMSARKTIKVKYIGRIDQNITTDQARRPGSPVVSFLIPLFNASLLQLKNFTWTYKSATNIARPLSETVAMFPTHAPYLLKDPMLLMFTRLFLMGDEIAESLTTVGIEVGDKWHEHTRDQFLYTYCGDWEKRPIDCVERTYIATRDEVRWFARNKVDENGFVILQDEEEDESDGEGDDEHDDGQDG
jgi:hypothetical protein